MCCPQCVTVWHVSPGKAAEAELTPSCDPDLARQARSADQSTRAWEAGQCQWLLRHINNAPYQWAPVMKAYEGPSWHNIQLYWVKVTPCIGPMELLIPRIACRLLLVRAVKVSVVLIKLYQYPLSDDSPVRSSRQWGSDTAQNNYNTTTKIVTQLFTMIYSSLLFSFFLLCCEVRQLHNCISWILVTTRGIGLRPAAIMSKLALNYHPE